MNRDEWNQVLDTAPATPNQRGAIMREFARLGITDRAERLAITAGLLGIVDLASTHDLTMGQAGRLVGMLPGIDDRNELTDAVAASARPSTVAVAGCGRPQLAEVYTLHAVAAAYLAWNNCLHYSRDQQ
jgi:hypothetical protein